jgi:hypothetical protein
MTWISNFVMLLLVRHSPLPPPPPTPPESPPDPAAASGSSDFSEDNSFTSDTSSMLRIRTIIRATSECEYVQPVRLIAGAFSVCVALPVVPSSWTSGDTVPVNWVSHTFEGIVLDSARITRSQLKAVSTSELTVSTRACLIWANVP